MRVVIRHSSIGLYYAGPRHWVGDPDAAMELGTIQRAKDLSRKESLGQVEVVTIFDDPARDFGPPLERKRGARRLPSLYAVGTENTNPKVGCWDNKENIEFMITTLKGLKKEVFRIIAPNARSVLLVGDFTQWQKNAIPLQRQHDGAWVTTVALPPGKHTYRFLVDGEWRDDPECAVRVPNPYGSQDMVREAA